MARGAEKSQVGNVLLLGEPPGAEVCPWNDVVHLVARPVAEGTGAIVPLHHHEPQPLGHVGFGHNLIPIPSWAPAPYQPCAEA